MAHNKFFLKILSKKHNSAFFVVVIDNSGIFVTTLFCPMKNLLVFSCILFATVARTQFYYNDIIGTQELNQRMKDYVTNRVASITATGFDAYGMKNTSFYELYEVKENGRLLQISSLDEINRKNTLFRFDNNGIVVTQTDSTIGIKDVIEYKYDNNGRLRSILNTTTDTENEFNQTEEHGWIYTANGAPEKMWKIMNGKDSLLYQFTLDAGNNVIDEYQVKNKFKYDPLYYYYYDATRRLTDVARYNKIVKKILPDLMFEYDEQNHVIQKIATVSGAQVGYVIFRFGFNEKGLKTKEVLFNKLKQKTGSIEYQYTFN
jgi:hypothetical protein